MEVANNKTLTVAFLGTNHPHMFHRIEVLNEMQDVAVLGFFEEDDLIAKKFSTRYGDYRRFSDMSDLLNQRPDLVIVETKLAQIAEYAKRAAPYTRALLLEKATAPDLETALELAAYLKNFPVHVEHGYYLNFFDVIDKCQEIINSGVMGQITLARFHGKCPVGIGAEPWQNDPDCIGGIVYTEAGHMIDLMLCTLGVPISVNGIVVKLPHGESLTSDFVWTDTFHGPGEPVNLQVGTLMYEDIGAAVLTYPDKIATFDITAWEATGWDKGWPMEFYGTNASMTVHLFESVIELSVKDTMAGYDSGEHIIRPQGFPQESDSAIKAYTTPLKKKAHAKQLGGLFDHLRNNCPPSQKGMDTLVNIIKILNGIYCSSKNGGQSYLI